MVGEEPAFCARRHSRDDLDRILSLLAVQPGVGAQARGTKLQGVRRVTLSRIRYYVYYRATDQALEVYGKRFGQWADQPVAIFATVGESSRLRKGCGNKASRKGKFGLRHDT